MIRLAVAGAGRMGQAIVRLVADGKGDGGERFSVAALWVRDPANTAIELPADGVVSDDLDRVLEHADVLIDFSLPEATHRVLDAARRNGTALVCGVSGLSDDQLIAIDAAARDVPIVYDRNMSQGIAVLERLVSAAARSLGQDFAVRIEETHHAHKKDTPSGTALKLGEAVEAARDHASGEIIDYHAERLGEVPGDHTVVFRSADEHLALAHSVSTRDVFARGALRAAGWVAGRKAGRYSMQDVLFHD